MPNVFQKRKLSKWSPKVQTGRYQKIAKAGSASWIS